MKKNTLTIGIPAYNEEKTINKLFTSLLKQKKNNFTLDKIIVYSDGSTDKTVSILKKLKETNPIITILEDKTQKGKTSRLNGIYKINRSDFLLTLDADVVLGTEDEIEKFIAKFDDKKIMVAAGNLIPRLKNRSFISKSIYLTYLLWNAVREQFPDGDSIYNLYGSASMIRGSFAKKITYPENITSDEGFLYCKAKQVNGFTYVKTSKIYHTPVNTIADYRIFLTRSYTERFILEKYFGKKVKKYYHVPQLYKIRSVISFLFKSPLLTSFALGINIFVRMFPHIDILNEKGQWVQIASTKIG